MDATTQSIPSAFNYVGVAYIKQFKEFKNYLSKYLMNWEN